MSRSPYDLISRRHSQRPSRAQHKHPAEPSVLEIMLDTSSMLERNPRRQLPDENLQYLSETIAYLQSCGYPLQIKLTYTSELVREQMDLMDSKRVLDRSYLPKNKIVEQLRQLEDHVEILPESLKTRLFAEKLLALVKAVARQHPEAHVVKRCLPVLGFTQVEQLQTLQHIDAQQTQILYDRFVVHVPLLERYHDIPEAHDLHAMRKDSADETIFEHLRTVAGTWPHSKKGLCVVVANDEGLRYKAANIPTIDALRIAPITPSIFNTLLKTLVADCHRRFPGSEPPPFNEMSSGVAPKKAAFLVNNLMASQRQHDGKY